MSKVTAVQSQQVPELTSVVEDEYEPLEEGSSFDILGLLGRFGDAPAWAISMVLHLVVLALLGSFIQETVTENYSAIDASLEDTEADPTFDAVVVDQVGNESELNSLTSSQEMAQARGDNPQQEVQKQLEEDILPLTTPPVHDLEMPAESEFISTVDTRGSQATENPGGVEGSIDRLTMEIASSLKERKTLVVWLFDASFSLQERREAIANRFENVYRQLDALEVGADKALKTAVASYGEKTTIMTPEPIDDIASIVQSVRNIKNDASGKENVFAAVYETARKWQSYRVQSRRNMMMILVTDERGDDFDKMESTIQFVRRNGIKCYVVGNAAPFGREHGYVTWTYPDESTEDLPVDQGPETVAPEAIRLPFWGTNGRDLDRMSSGYGPYALTRLCAETGGMFLIAAEDGRGARFDHEIMRNYPPDYSPIRNYQQELVKNKAKGALVAAATSTQVKAVPVPQLAFRADTDTALRVEITEAQKPAADLSYRLGEMLEILGQGEKDREKITEPRWQASYDLAIGRALAMQARVYGYNSVLAEMKGSPKPFSKKGSNQWQLVPSSEITSGPAIKKIANKASMYLKRVIDDHPDTPWATLAERELSQPLGWEWKENQVNLPSMGMGPNGEPNLLLLAEEEKKKEAARKKAAERAKLRPNL